VSGTSRSPMTTSTRGTMPAASEVEASEPATPPVEAWPCHLSTFHKNDEHQRHQVSAQTNNIEGRFLPLCRRMGTFLRQCTRVQPYCHRAGPFPDHHRLSHAGLRGWRWQLRRLWGSSPWGGPTPTALGALLLRLLPWLPQGWGPLAHGAAAKPAASVHGV
jgi:hypothetical protein